MMHLEEAQPRLQEEGRNESAADAAKQRLGYRVTEHEGFNGFGVVFLYSYAVLCAFHGCV